MLGKPRMNKTPCNTDDQADMKRAYIISIPCKTFLLSTVLRKLLLLRYRIYHNIISVEESHKAHTSTQVHKEW